VGRNRASLDEKDLRIVRALDKYGPKATTKKLSKILKIPPRTLRYRFSRLRAKGYLQPLGIFTHERRIGLGENIVVVDLSPSDKPFPLEFFEKTHALYLYSPTYGKMNGFAANVLYPLDSPSMNVNVLELLKDAGLVSAYIIFDIVTYTTKGWDFSWFDSDGRWTWDWRKWHQRIDSILKSGKSDVVFDIRDQTEIPFDSRDVMLLRMLHENAEVTQKRLAVKLGLPVSQVRRRFQRLQDLGVILGYKSIFTPFKDTLSLMCFIESSASIAQIATCLYELPYALDVLIESSSRICIRLDLSATDFVGFFRGLDRMRHLA